MSRLTPNWKKEEIIKLYNSGVSQNKIEKLLKITGKTIRSVIKNSEIYYRNKSEQQMIRCGNTIDETVFDELNEESLYWIGFLYADGHITDGIKDKSIQIGLKDIDIKHLEKFKEFVKTSRSISKYKNKDAIRIRINSQKLWQKLKGFGFDNNKSFTAKPHELLKNSRDFWRGVIDGDGGIYNKRVKTIYLVGTFETIKGFIEFVKINKVPALKSNELYQVGFYSKNAKQIADLLYKDSKIYLDRKYEKYLEFQDQK